MRHSRATAGDQAGRLLLAAGALTIVNNYLPGSEHLDLVILNSVALAAVALGLVALAVPWERLHPRASLVLVLPAFGLIAASNLLGGVSDFSYAVYFVVVFVWLGIAHPPGTSLWLAPVVTVAYVLPFVVVDDPPEHAIASAPVAVPVCVLVGEVLARSVRRLEQSRAELRSRVRLVERLAVLTSELGQDLDADAVARRLLASARELLGAPAAAYAELADGRLRVCATDGLPDGLSGSSPTQAGSPLADADWPASVVERDATDVAAEWGCPAGDLPGGPVLVAACGTRSPLGSLLVFLPEGRPVEPEARDVLRLLAAQGAAALVNAQTHTEVVEQHEHEQAVVDALADGVLVLDRSGCVTSCNAAAVELLGTPREVLVGGPPPLAVAPPGTALHHPVGRRWVETAATTLPGTGEVVVVLRDVSRQRALDEAKDLFLAATSHELRTPLTAIKGYVHMLQRRWHDLDDAQRQEALATVADRTDALVTLTDHLLLGARATASRESAETGPFDLGTAVASAVAAHEGLSTRHRLVVEPPEEPVTALGDPASVRQVVGQLVENAVKYSPRGGDVLVRVRTEDDVAVVEVADEGVGIPEGSEAALFTPFYQAGPSTTREYGGVGLGLYIVRQLVEAGGGTASAHNRPGGGALLRVTLPLALQPTLGGEDTRDDVPDDVPEPFSRPVAST